MYASEFSISETGNWNVAKSFSEVKIMNPMINCEMYEDAAIHGFDSIISEVINTDFSVDRLRVAALKRLNSELIKLCNNAKFAMKKSGSRDKLLKIREKLKTIRKDVIPHIYSYTVNQAKNTKQITINEKIFEKTLDLLIELKSDINVPLNMNDLIFTHTEEFDPNKYKEKIKERIVNKG